MLLLLLSSHDFALVVRGLPNRTKMDIGLLAQRRFARGRNNNKLLRLKNKGIFFPWAVGGEAKVSDSERSGGFISQTVHGVQVVRHRFLERNKCLRYEIQSNQ